MYVSARFYYQMYCIAERFVIWYDHNRQDSLIMRAPEFLNAWNAHLWMKINTIHLTQREQSVITDYAKMNALVQVLSAFVLVGLLSCSPFLHCLTSIREPRPKFLPQEATSSFSTFPASLLYYSPPPSLAFFLMTIAPRRDIEGRRMRL